MAAVGGESNLPRFGESPHDFEQRMEWERMTPGQQQAQLTEEAAQAEFGREQQVRQQNIDFITPYTEQLGSGSYSDYYADTGPSESEQILIQAQEEAGEKEINRLQDTLSGAGILSSGRMVTGTAEILGATRGAVAQTSAEFAESRLTRQQQAYLAEQQNLMDLILSVLS